MTRHRQRPRRILRSRTLLGLLLATMFCATFGCDDDGPGETTEVGTFDGLFDGLATGLNFPLDIAIVPEGAGVEGGALAGDILLASYGTSEIMIAENPSDGAVVAQQFVDGSAAGLLGATAVSIPPDGMIWAAFEQGGAGDQGGLLVVSQLGEVVTLLDGTTDAEAFAHPGGLCWGGTIDDGAVALFFMVNLGDGTVWRLAVASTAGDDPVLTRLGNGLATGTPGAPGTPGNGLTSSNDLPEGGARGCVYHEGQLYVADAQHGRVVRFADAATAADSELALLPEAPPDLMTYPTGVAVNHEGALIVLSYDNAHAFVSLALPAGTFLDNGLYELNVNAGNHGVAVAEDTIWFTRANNQNGTLRAITHTQDEPPSAFGVFPAQ